MMRRIKIKFFFFTLKTPKKIIYELKIIFSEWISSFKVVVYVFCGYELV
jgi:hypothetical protein